jgi:hypothetical protein
MKLSEELYRFLLRAYPRPYRERYGEPMAQLFRDRLRDADTPAKTAAFWVRTAADWAVTVPARHWERLTRTPLRTLGGPARRCVFYASYEAGSFAAGEITVEHLLLGILRQEPSLVSEICRQAICRAIEEKAPARQLVARVARPLRLSEHATRALETAGEIAGQRRVAPRDLAAGIPRLENTLPARLLREHMRD